LLKRLDQPISPRELVGNLKVGQQQLIEIAKALAEDADILILDEPTSALSKTEVDILFRVIRELTRQGVSIIYISHRLEELMAIGDVITILRDGKFQAEARVGYRRAVDRARNAGQRSGEQLPLTGADVWRAGAGSGAHHLR
jgi:erythritol transport system ATP-binding protein